MRDSIHQSCDAGAPRSVIARAIMESPTDRSIWHSPNYLAAEREMRHQMTMRIGNAPYGVSRALRHRRIDPVITTQRKRVTRHCFLRIRIGCDRQAEAL